MAERQVTIEGVRRELAVPFLVVATQNPCGYEGTFPMPESQLDRFLFKLPVNYPDPESEVSMLLGHVGQDGHEPDGPLLQIDEICKLQSLVKSIHVADSVARYIVELASRTRHDPQVLLGASPRGALMLLRASQARAMLNGRDYVNPDDIQALAPDVLAHRLVLLQETRNDPAEQGMDAAARRIIVRLLQQLPVPN
jgi:MoxR-like ATPase